MKPHRRYVEVKNTNPITYDFFLPPLLYYVTDSLRGLLFLFRRTGIWLWRITRLALNFYGMVYAEYLTCSLFTVAPVIQKTLWCCMPSTSVESNCAWLIGLRGG